MNWTEPNPPTKGVSSYDHVICETPLGQCIIEWKGWKQHDTYSITINDKYIDDALTLDGAKKMAEEWLLKKNCELANFLGLSLFKI